MMDPKKTGSVDYRHLDKSINKLFPDKNATGLLCIDLENDSYDKLKGNNLTRYKPVSDKEYKKSADEFIKLIRYVKSKRPNVKVGVYGMPFKAYTRSEIRKGSNQLLDPILSEVDVIFPSLYIPHTSKDQGLSFLKLNLETSLSYGERLNKPVIPFFWYLLFSTDKSSRYEMIPRKDMHDYIQYIENYEPTKGRKVAGIVWWDTPTQYNRKLIKQNLLKAEEKKVNWTMERQFQYYFDK